MIDPYIFDTSDYDVSFDGGKTWFVDVNATLTPEDVERIRTGYECIVCYQRFDSAWPKRCPFPTCGFPVETHQPEAFARTYGGIDTDIWKPSEVEERLTKNGVYIAGLPYAP